MEFAKNARTYPRIPSKFHADSWLGILPKKFHAEQVGQCEVLLQGNPGYAACLIAL